MENEKKLKMKNVQTYTDDMVKALEESQGSIIKKIIHEEEAHQAEKKNLSPKTKKNKMFMIIGSVLILVSILLVAGLFIFRKDIGVVEVEPEYVPLIFLDKTSFQAVDDLDKIKLLQNLLNKISQTEVKKGGVEGIYLTKAKKVIGLKEFFEITEANFDLKDDIIQNNFLLGVVNNSQAEKKFSGENFFILLRVKSFADVFEKMRDWENKMFYDLNGLLGINISAETNYLFTKNFSDGIMANKNARILYDQNDNIVLMYVYLDDNSVLIATVPETINEITQRLSSSQIRK